MTKFTRRRFVKGAAIAPLAVKHMALQQVTGTSDRFDIVVAGAGAQQLDHGGVPGEGGLPLPGSGRAAKDRRRSENGGN